MPDFCTSTLWCGIPEAHLLYANSDQRSAPGAQVVLFCFAAFQALVAAFAALLGPALPRGWRDRTIVLPLAGPAEALSLAACAPAAGVVIAWVLGRHAAWGWALQDAMGVSLMMLLLRQFRLPNIKVRAASICNRKPCDLSAR